jgi:hypothetical protein
MSDETKHGNTADNSGFERQDLQPSSILYFLLALGVATLLCIIGLRGLYAYLDNHEKPLQPAVNPLVTNVPADTRHIAPGYPQSAFPSPRLEKIEGDELDGDLIKEEKTLYSYGWVDEKAGTVRIPIERAMDLLVQRGLPVRPQGVASEVAGGNTGIINPQLSKAGTGRKDKKK